MSKIIIAGGAGFIGSNLSRDLLGNGNKLLIIDNFITGSSDNIKSLIGDECQLINGDIRDESIFKELDDNYDCIINLACIASPKRYYEHPVDTLMTSVVGTKNLLDFSLRINASFIQSSTSEVYGDSERELLEESYNGNVNCTGFRACYDEGKRAAETLCMDYQRCHDQDIKIIRIFNTYGPNMAIEDGRVIPEFIMRALKNEPLQINGSGNQTRSFMYVDDLINAIKKIISYKGIISQPLNIGNPNEELNLNQLAKRIIELTGSQSLIHYNPPLKDDPRKRRPDIKRAKEILGWQPLTNLDTGLLKTIDFFKTRTEI